MILTAVAHFLYNKLLDVLENNFCLIKFLIENFYSNLTELGVFHNILAEENLIKDSRKENFILAKMKTRFGNNNYIFTFGQKVFGKTKTIKKNSIQNDKLKKLENLTHSSNRNEKNLISEVSITPRL